jgi:hypothetical protein
MHDGKTYAKLKRCLRVVNVPLLDDSKAVVAFYLFFIRLGCRARFKQADIPVSAGKLDESGYCPFVFW